MKFSPEYRLGIFFIILGSFYSIFSWEKGGIRHRKIPETTIEMQQKIFF